MDSEPVLKRTTDLDSQPAAIVPLACPPVAGRLSAVGMPAHPGTTLLTGKETVLVVGDAVMVRGALIRILREYGYRVFGAANTIEAQQLAAGRANINLLLIDYSRSENNGVHLAVWFRAIHPEIRVLVASDSLWELDLSHGGYQQITFLVKPFTPLELVRMVRRVLK